MPDDSAVPEPEQAENGAVAVPDPGMVMVNAGQGWVTAGWITAGTTAFTLGTPTWGTIVTGGSYTIGTGITYTSTANTIRYADADPPIAYGGQIVYDPARHVTLDMQTGIVTTDEQRRRTETDEQRAERVEQERVYRERAVEQERARDDARRLHVEQREAADARARELLFSFLDDEQRANYERDLRFDVIGSAGTRFTIGAGCTGNITAWRADGTLYGRVCVHPGGNLPMPDMHLGQMLELQADEEAFMRIANLYEGERLRYRDGMLVDDTAQPAAPSETGPWPPVLNATLGRVCIQDANVAADLDIVNDVARQTARRRELFR